MSLSRICGSCINIHVGFNCESPEPCWKACGIKSEIAFPKLSIHHRCEKNVIQLCCSQWERRGGGSGWEHLAQSVKTLSALWQEKFYLPHSWRFYPRPRYGNMYKVLSGIAPSFVQPMLINNSPADWIPWDTPWCLYEKEPAICALKERNKIAPHHSGINFPRTILE